MAINVKSTGMCPSFFESNEANMWQWTHMLNVGMETTTILPISKDNAVFGLRAVGKNGMKSPATYALAVASQYFG